MPALGRARRTQKQGLLRLVGVSGASPWHEVAIRKGKEARQRAQEAA